MDFRWPKSRSHIEVIHRERKRIAVERGTFQVTPEVTLLPRGTVAKDFEANVKAPRFVDRRG